MSLDGCVRVVFTSLLLDLVAFTVLLPLLPSLLEHYAQHDTSGVYAALAAFAGRFGRAVGAPAVVMTSPSVLVGGALGSLFSLLQFAAAPITGRLSDAGGRRPALLLCLAGVAASHALWYAAGANFAVFVAARVLCGLSKGNVNLASAIVADVTDTASRGRGMAWIGVAFSLGFIVGPTVGGVLAASHVSHVASLPALLALSLSLANLAFVWLALPESLDERRRRPFGRRADAVVDKTTTVDSLWNFISPAALLQFRAVDCADQQQMRCLRRVGLVYLLYLLVFSGVEFTLTFHCHERFGFSPAQQGAMFLYMGVLMAVVQGGMVRRLPEHRMERCALVGVALLPVAFCLLAAARAASTLVLALTVYAASTAVCVPCLTTVATRYGGPQHRGTVTGVLRSLGALARAVGPLLACSAFWLCGAGRCYVAAAAASLVPAALLATFRCCRPRQDKLQVD